MRVVKLQREVRYPLAVVLQAFAGWSNVDWSNVQQNDGYVVDHYFDQRGMYLGPDKHGIEPMFEVPEVVAITGPDQAFEYIDTRWCVGKESPDKIEVFMRDYSKEFLPTVHLLDRSYVDDAIELGCLIDQRPVVGDVDTCWFSGIGVR